MLLLTFFHTCYTYNLIDHLHALGSIYENDVLHFNSLLQERFFTGLHSAHFGTVGPKVVQKCQYLRCFQLTPVALFLCFQTNIGPIVLSVNSFREIGNPLTLTSTQEVTCPELAKVVEEAVRLQNESGYPQTIIGEYTSKIETLGISTMQ